MRAYAPEPGAGARVRRTRRAFRADAHRREALSVLPLRARRHRRGTRPARRAGLRSAGNRGRRPRPAARRDAAGRRAGGEEGDPRTSSTASSAAPSWSPPRSLPGHGLGQLPPAAATRRPRACCQPACEHDPEIAALFPANMSANLTVRARGETYRCQVTVPKGEPANFLTEAELRAKFVGLAAPCWARSARRGWPMRCWRSTRPRCGTADAAGGADVGGEAGGGLSGAGRPADRIGDDIRENRERSRR